MAASAIIQDLRLPLALLAPFVGAGLVMATGKKPNLREACSLIAALAMFGLIASLLPGVLAGKSYVYPLFELVPAKMLHPAAGALSLTLRADAMSLIFAAAASFLWVLAVFYSAGYMRGLEEHAQTRFNACFALALFGAIGTAFSDNLLTLYFFYEVVSIVTYPLVAHHQDGESYEGAKKYMVYLTTTAKGLVLPAMVLIYVVTGTLDFSHDVTHGIFAPEVNRWVVTGLYAACLLGFAKNGIMPFHSWLPSAMVAPTPVSALLHAVAVVKVGVFATTRVMLYVFGVTTMNDLNLGIPTAYFVSFTILIASVIALSKDNLKARLAYSTVSQLSYIVLGVALLTPTGVQGGLMHIAMHAFAKITLFFCAGAIYVATHKKNISQMEGLGRVMPWTFGAFAIASLSMIGAPPVGGFVSKLFMLVGIMDASAVSPWALGLLVVLIASTVLNAAYFAPVIYKAFFGKLSAEDEHHHYGEAPLTMVIPLCITAAISAVLGFYPNLVVDLAKLVIS
jgi:multicomponent Na+:H+ antiporter subunit D